MQKRNLLFFIILMAIVPFFFIGGPGHYSARSLKSLWNFGHIFFFCLAAYLVLSLVITNGSKNIFRQLIVMVVGCFLLGGTIEILQHGLSRNPDIGDLLRNLIGTLLGLWLFLKSSTEIEVKQDSIKRYRFILGAIVFAAITYQLYGLTQVVFDEWRGRKDFPVLADFESSLELSRWSGGAEFEVSQSHPSSGSNSLKVTLGTQKYSGVSLNYFPLDWRGYEQLSFDVFNSEKEQIKLTLRIHDRLHRKGERRYRDRFNRSFFVRPGENSIEVDLENVVAAPKTRVMDVTAIEAIGLFTVDSPRKKVIYLDNLRLLK